MKKIIFGIMILFLLPGFVSSASALETNTYSKSFLGKTIPEEVQYQNCDAAKSCLDGLECYILPGMGSPKCVNPNPCSYYQCTGNTECSVLETYPPKVMCSCKGGTCLSSSIQSGCVISKNLETRKESIVCPTEQPIETSVTFSGETTGFQGTISGGEEGTYANGTSVIIAKEENVENGVMIKIGPIEFETFEEVTVQNSKLYMKTSNGKNTEIKIAPETASEKALERLNLKVCSVENNCTIVLKEVGKQEEIKTAYEFQAEKRGKILGLFNARMELMTQVDAESGEVIKDEKPWWVGMFSESKEESSE